MTNPILDPIVHDFQSYAPIDQQVMPVSQWFATETMEVEVGETVGRPAQEVKLSRDVVTYLLANGWYITEYLASAEGGEWTSSATATVTSASGSTSASNASSKANFESSSDGGDGDGSTTGFSEGESSSSGSTSNSGASTTVSENGGAPFWYSCFKVRLQRRRIQAENVLQDMINSFTEAYNEGRKVNSDRYDELVSLYALMISKTESEANNAPIINVNVDDFAALNVQIRDAAMERLSVAAGILDDLVSDAYQAAHTRLDSAMDKLYALYTYARGEIGDSPTLAQKHEDVKMELRALDGVIDDIKSGGGLQNVRDQLKLAIGDFKEMYDDARAAVSGAQKLTMDDFKAMYDAAREAINNAQKLTMDDFKAMYDAAKEAVDGASKLTIDDFKAMYDAAKEAIGGTQKLTMDDFKAMYDAAKEAIGGVKVITAQDIKDMYEAARASIQRALAKFAESVDGLPEGWLESRKADINRKFDALLSSAASDMVTNGIYNSTTWPTTQSGIERDRAYALNNLVDEISRIKIDAYGKIATITADVEARALDAPLKLADIERSLAELETVILNAGMKLIDIQRGFADIEIKVLDAGNRLADVQKGLADTEIRMSEVGARLADVQNGFVGTEIKVLDAGNRLADVQKGLADTETRMLDAGMKLADVERGLAGIELNIVDEKLKFADGNVSVAKAGSALADMERNLVDAEVRIADMLHKQTIGLTELRNNVLKWMLDFMERRDDEHPSLDSLVNVADKLGYAEGAPASNIS